MSDAKLSHVREDGSLAMVDVGAKPSTARTARAEARVRLNAAAAGALRAATLAKGDAFAAAQLAGIMAAKRTDELIPLAHPIALGAVDVSFGWDDATAGGLVQTQPSQWSRRPAEPVTPQTSLGPAAQNCDTGQVGAGDTTDHAPPPQCSRVSPSWAQTSFDVAPPIAPT